MTHTKKLYDYNAIKVAYNMEELFSNISFYLNNPNYNHIERENAVKFICGSNFGRSKKEYLKVINKILEK